jgi:hypothetical protein
MGELFHRGPFGLPVADTALTGFLMALFLSEPLAEGIEPTSESPHPVTPSNPARTPNINTGRRIIVTINS